MKKFWLILFSIMFIFACSHGGDKNKDKNEWPIPDDVAFCSQWYLQTYPDVANSIYGGAPYRHYCEYGQAEGRLSCPPESPDTPNEDPTPNPDPTPTPSNNVEKLFGHKASFLLDDCKTRVMNLFSHRHNSGSRAKILDRLVRNGDNAIYVYLSDRCDDPNFPVNLWNGDYGAPTFKQSEIDRVKRIIEGELLPRGLRPIFWMISDDDCGNRVGALPTSTLKAYFSKMVDSFDRYALGWVIALEADEYMGQSKVEDLARHFQSITSNPIGIHLLDGHYTYAKSSNIDILFYQTKGWFPNGKSNSHVQSDILSVRSKVNKPVIAAEYHCNSDSSEARSRGQAAIAGGAVATGCGR